LDAITISAAGGGKMIGVGIHKISNEEYHKDPCIAPSLSRSIIFKLVFHSPAHAWWFHPRLNPAHRQDNDAKYDIGSAAHSLLLEGFNAVSVIDADDWRKKDTKEQRNQAQSEGRIPMLRKQWDIVEEMVLTTAGAIRECKELGVDNLLTDGDSELSYIWEEKGIFLRARPDWISKDRTLIIDYKTTGKSANPADFARQIIACGYDIQAALYSRGVKAIEGIEPKFVFVVQEVEKPYLCSFPGLPPEFLEMGKSKVEYGIFLWRQCMEKKEWPGYPNQVCWVDPPGWALSQWEQIAERICV
jgi:hypothetical protein